ncbi:MAG: helix-turn-helix transcriptional regulator [Methylobacterium sp.]
MAGQKTDERDIHLGQRMAEERKRSQLTQRRVAQSFGMSAAQLQKYEKGVNRISAVHLEILSRMTGIPIGEFFEGIPHLDDVPERGFADGEQHGFVPDGPWAGLAAAMAKHVANTFDEPARRDFATAVDTLQRELNR